MSRGPARGQVPSQHADALLDLVAPAHGSGTYAVLMTDDESSADTAPLPVVRLGEPLPSPEPLALTSLPAPPTQSRLRSRTLVAAGVAVAVTAAAALTYGITRQSPAAAQPPQRLPGAPSAAPTAAPAPVLGVTPSVAALPASEPTLVLGDSLGLIMYPWLADALPDRYVSYAGKVGSDTAWARAELEAMQQNGTKIPRVVLVSAGTNDFTVADFRRNATAILDLLGPTRCVVWADIARPGVVNGEQVASASMLTASLTEITAARPYVHLLAWSSLTAEHPSWLAGDGVHPIEEGARARTALYATAAAACSAIDPAAPRAARQVLPDSAFFGGGSSTGGTSSTGTSSTARPTTGTYQPQPAPTRSPARQPTRTPSASPSRSPSVDLTPVSTPTKTHPTRPDPTTTASSTPPGKASDPPPPAEGSGADPVP